MNQADRRKLFIHYMESVNYIGYEQKPKRLTMGKLERCLGIVILSCISLMTLWEILKEIIFKLRF